jgi:hypothetical protein
VLIKHNGAAHGAARYLHWDALVSADAALAAALDASVDSLPAARRD